MNTDIRQLANVEIEQHIVQLEEEYTEALKAHADVHKLSMIWRRIKELKLELQQRNGKT